ncbi:DNA polymerase III subunit beta [Candidatus Dependentiae bacterium]|nr:DNA polymerase III subunit beta [Candidatus Dependentiae bacterium]MCC7415458.1 DNA polymerase III subunit beta [Campylobacterota bacterium]
MENSFLVEQKPFMSLLASMQPICTKRTALDATSYILMQVGYKELVLKSTDLEISLQASYLLDGTSSSATPYSCMVSGKRIFDLVKELEGTITCNLVDQQLVLKAGGVTLSLNIKDAQEFPPFPECIENLMRLDGTVLLDMLSKVAFLIPQNNANPALNGLYLEVSEKQMKMTTTDGHCLAQVSTSMYTLDEPKKWLLPRRAVFEVKKLLEGSGSSHLFLGLCGNQLVFSGDSFNFFTKLLADPFPQYTPILNKQGFRPATVDRAHFIKTLRRSVCLLSGQFIATQFGFHRDELSVSMDNKEVGQLTEKLALDAFEGDSIDIRFYAPYVLSGLQAFSDDKLSFYLHNGSKPIIFESTHEDRQVTYLVMPVSPTTAQL